MNIKFYFISFLVLKYLKYIYREYVLKTPCSIDYRSPSLLWKISFSSLSLPTHKWHTLLPCVSPVQSCWSSWWPFVHGDRSNRLISPLSCLGLIPPLQASQSWHSLCSHYIFSLLSWWTYMSSWKPWIGHYDTLRKIYNWIMFFYGLWNQVSFHYIYNPYDTFVEVFCFLFWFLLRLEINFHIFIF